MSQQDIDVTDLLSRIISTVGNARATLKSEVADKTSGQMETEKGMSLLELKNHAQLSYLINLVYLIMRKLHGLSIKDSQSVGILVELRILLERLRPIEDKLKYQIEKYIETPSLDAAAAKENELGSKGNLDNIESSSEDEADEDNKTNNNKGGDGKVYKIPKITQVHYPGDEEKSKRGNSREKNRMLHSSMVQDALSEYVEDPEVMQTSNVYKQKAMEKRRMIQRYEEDNFTRLTLSKRDKHSLKGITTPGTLAGELLAFRDPGATDKTSKKRKRSIGKGKKGKKGSKKWKK